jgi:hypothetical protein
MTAIKTLEKRVEALEPEPPSEDFSWLSRLTNQELHALDTICTRLEALPEGEQTLTHSEREIVEAIERRLVIDQETQG